MTAKKKAVHNEASDAPEQTLTAEQQQQLAEAGLDWRQLLEALRKSPVLKMVIQQLLDTFFNPQPAFEAASGTPAGHAHGHKDQLRAVLRMQLCAAHCLAHQIDCRDDDHEQPA